MQQRQMRSLWMERCIAMRQKKVWRYYCDHCKKGGCGKWAMAKHEQHCTNNPQRRCRCCDDNVDAHDLHIAIVEFRCAFAAGGSAIAVPALRFKVGGCPMCMLAVIRQSGVQTAIQSEPDQAMWVQWDYKSEREAWFAAANEEAMDASDIPW